jgi:hypothetical protein
MHGAPAPRCTLRFETTQRDVRFVSIANSGVFQDETRVFPDSHGKGARALGGVMALFVQSRLHAAMDSGPTRPHNHPSPTAQAHVFAEFEERATVTAHERAQHFGVSAMILGVALVFLGFLVRAERREMQLLLSASSRCEMELLVMAPSNAGSTAPAGPPNASSATDASMCAPTAAIERGATGYGHSLLAAAGAAALAALTLVARRRWLWIAAALGVLVCMSAATATFAGTRAETHRLVVASRSYGE